MCFLCPLSPGVPWCFTQERSGTAGMDVGDAGRAHPADSDGAAPALFAQPLMPGGGSSIIPIPSPLWALFRSRHPELASCIPLSIWKRSPLGTRMSQAAARDRSGAARSPSCTAEGLSSKVPARVGFSPTTTSANAFGFLSPAIYLSGGVC